ncbi:unnamed protein product [Rangifer tarandus platyrhynchus]|uniref:Uncharacterized protein n=2 Tax=Rangifer tarandus platyrhynchus TaxID=3082113 RepID=A0ABN8ZJY8_RANTA|nr:unnamed protein product [Rangifer tarandus platyrhynchus]CAI9708336.1 unnamed protein product [Rangifer tarandus platyrhynchus]
MGSTCALIPGHDPARRTRLDICIHLQRPVDGPPAETCPGLGDPEENPEETRPDRTLLMPPHTKPRENQAQGPEQLLTREARVRTPCCVSHSAREELAGRWLSFEDRKNMLRPHNHSTA